MCGITGILNFDSAPVDRGLLVRMTRVLSHRGPDDEGIYISGGIGLGHRRLSIIDLSSRGRQPMSNEKGNIWICFNGEIYNHLKLRQSLIELGHQYKSLTDTETIIHLYEEKGIECLAGLDGEFAFCIWDSDKKMIFAARDRLGVKPFYYGIFGKSFVFASEIKSILLHPEVKKELDPQALSHYLSFSVSPAPLTLFKGVSKLEAGHFFTLSEKGILKKGRYWDPIPKEKINRPQEEIVEDIRSRLKNEVSQRLMSDVPFGAFLSGGVDSSTNVAIMSKLVHEPLNTFNVAIDSGRSYDESRAAGSVSEFFKTRYHSMRINRGDFFKLFELASYHLDEPLCDFACIPNFYLAKLARDNSVAVIQVGEGNDELFCGYKSYAAIMNLIKFYYPLPALVKKPFFSLLNALSGGKLHYAIRRASENEEVFLGGSYLFTEKDKASLFSPGVKLSRMVPSHGYVSGIYAHLLQNFPEADPLDKMTYLDLRLRLPELLLMRADKMSMANSVEARLPFLGYNFVEYALSLPSGLKYRHNQTKYIFKKALKGILPEEIIFQSKKGFAGNPVNIFHEDLQNYFFRLYKETEPLLGEYFNLGEVRKRISFNAKRMPFREGMKIWSIFTLMLWMKSYFTGARQ